VICTIGTLKFGLDEDNMNVVHGAHNIKVYKVNFNNIIFIYIHFFTCFGRALPSSGSSICDVENIVIGWLTQYTHTHTNTYIYIIVTTF
jgi:hypothetical protein